MAKATRELQKRSDVPVEHTWNLEDIFATDNEWEEALKELKAEIPELKSYQGKLGESAETLLSMLKEQDAFGKKLGKLFTYAHMRKDQDKIGRASCRERE